jgi:hypothetical protein
LRQGRFSRKSKIASLLGERENCPLGLFWSAPILAKKLLFAIPDQKRKDNKVGRR